MPSLIAILGLDASGFRGGLEAARLHADRVGNRIGSALSGRIAGFLSAGAVAAAVKHTIDWAGKLQDVSDALGVSVEWLQKMQNGAATAGGKIEDLEKSMVALNQAREDALRKPGGENAKALGRMGFSQGDIASLPAQQFYDRMVKLFANGGSAQLENDVVQVGGKSAKNLLAAFHNQFQSDVPLVSEAMIEQLDDLGDRFTAFGQTMTATLAPAIIVVLNAVMSFVGGLKQLWAGLVGFSTNLKGIDLAQLLINPIGFFTGAKGKEAVANAQTAVVSEDADQQNAKDVAEIAAKARAKARAERRKKAPFPDVQEDEKKPLAAKSSPQMKLNALQQIGGYAALPPGEVQMHGHVAQIARHVSDIARKTNDGVNY